MLLRMQKVIHDLLALFRVPQPLLGEVLLKYFVDPRCVAFAARGPGWEKNKFFGERSHVLIETGFQYSISRLEGSSGIFFFDDVEELQYVVYFVVRAGMFRVLGITVTCKHRF